MLVKGAQVGCSKPSETHLNSNLAEPRSSEIYLSVVILFWNVLQSTAVVLYTKF